MTSPLFSKHVWWQIFNRMDHLAWDDFKDTLKDVPELQSVVAQYLMFEGPRHKLYLSIIKKVSIQEHGDPSYHNFTQCMRGYYDSYWFCQDCQKYCSQQAYSITGHCTKCGEHMNVYHSSLNDWDVLSGVKNPWVCEECRPEVDVPMQVLTSKCRTLYMDGSKCPADGISTCISCKNPVCKMHSEFWNSGVKTADALYCSDCFNKNMDSWIHGFQYGWYGCLGATVGLSLLCGIYMSLKRD